jgi:molybdate transport system regulatory protein
MVIFQETYRWKVLFVSAGQTLPALSQRFVLGYSQRCWPPRAARYHAAGRKSYPMPRVTIRIDFGDGRNIGHGKIRLLEMIAQHGSISRATREMGMTYRRAWLLADEVNTMFYQPVLETQHGGAGGGHARLTSFGHALIGHYRAIEAHSANTYRKQLAVLGRSLRDKQAAE